MKIAHHLIVSFDTKTNSTLYHIVSVNNGLGDGNTTLNFNSKYLITGVNKVEELLYFTDNYTAPKQINVTKNYIYIVPGYSHLQLLKGII